MIVFSSLLFHLFLIQTCTGARSRMHSTIQTGLVEACPGAQCAGGGAPTGLETGTVHSSLPMHCLMSMDVPMAILHQALAGSSVPSAPGGPTTLSLCCPFYDAGMWQSGHPCESWCFLCSSCSLDKLYLMKMMRFNTMSFCNFNAVQRSAGTLEIQIPNQAQGLSTALRSRTVHPRHSHCGT